MTQDFFFQAHDGLRLHAVLAGSDTSSAMPVVCLPGLTRNARDFSGLIDFLSSRQEAPRRIVAFDYRGRGLSDYDPDWRNYLLAVEARDCLDGLSALGIDRAHFIGTSRGGLIIHLLAASRLGLIASVVLNDVGPELGREGLDHIKEYLAASKTPQNFAEAVAIQRATHGSAFSSLTDQDWERFAAALYRNSDGNWRLDFDHELLHGVAAIDLDAPLPDLWKEFDAMRNTPLLVIRGDASRLLTQETLAGMQEHHPEMESITVAGQGHAPLLETSGLLERIADFIDRSEKSA